MRIKLSSNVMAKAIVTRVEPVYPEDAKHQHIEGQVILHAIIGIDGAIKELAVISGPQQLTQAALDAVRQWHCQPTLLNGIPLEVDTTVAVDFLLEPSSGNTNPPPIGLRDLSGKVSSQSVQSIPCTNLPKSYLETAYPEAVCLEDLASLYMDQHQFDLAESTLKRALRVREKAVGPNHPDVVITINRLSSVLQTEGNYEEAEALIKRSLAIQEEAFGHNNLDVAVSTQALADLYHAQKRDTEAERLLREAIDIEEKALQPSDRAYPSISWTLTDLGRLLEAQRRYSEAEAVLTRALAIYQNAASPNYFNIGDSLFEVAIIFALEGNNAESESYLKQTLATMEKSLGAEHPHLAPVLEFYSALLQKMNRKAEAEKMEARAKAIRLKAKQ
jgi:TonB family protein